MKLRFGELKLKELVVQEMTSHLNLGWSYKKNESQMEDTELGIWKMIWPSTASSW